MEDFMRTTSAVALGFLAAVVAWTVPGHAQDQKPTVKIPEPGVPEIMTIEGHFVRVAYNNEGYVVLGYETANRSVGETWMLLELGITVREGVKNQKLTRSAFSLDTPDGKTLPLPSIEEYRKATNEVQGAQLRNQVQRESINYFPPSASKVNRLGFFSDLKDKAMAWDEVEITSSRGCIGRLYFPVTGGIKHGQYFLNVKFAGSVVRVPFRILTKDEEKMLSKNFGDIKKQVDAAFKPKKK
jgi:hypothetical protein